jgi:hypothetical protein
MRAPAVSGLFAVAILTFSSVTIRADMAPPYPVRKVDPHVRFDNLDEYPDWVFYLEYQRGNGNPSNATKQIIPLTSAEPLALTGTGRRVVASVVASPRTQVGDNDVPLPEGTPGVRRRQIYVDLAETFLIDLNDYYIAPYRVSLAGTDLKVEALPDVPVRPEINLGFGRLAVRQTVVALVLILAVIGVWLSWRRRRKAKRSALAQ